MVMVNIRRGHGCTDRFPYGEITEILLTLARGEIKELLVRLCRYIKTKLEYVISSFKWCYVIDTNM